MLFGSVSIATLPIATSVLRPCRSFSLSFVATLNHLHYRNWNFRSHCSCTELMVTMTAAKRIGTHNGAFHCDEALACYLLHRTSQYANAEIVRTRDPKILDTLDVVVDVGGIYDADRHRFDHHQRGFQDTFDSADDLKDEGGFTKVRLSSAGLVYKHFGKEVIANVVKDEAGSENGGYTEKGVIEDDQLMDVVWRKVYESFIQGIDAIDNGVERYDCKDVGEPRYEVNTDLSSRIGRLNVRWNEECTEEIQMRKFEKAMKLTGSEFEECVIDVLKSWLPARAIVRKAMKERFQVDEQGQVLVMKDWAPWKDHLYRIEQEESKTEKGMKPVIYVIYKDLTGATWRVQAVAIRKGSFESRKPLPVQWRGIRDADLSKTAGIEGCVFCHRSGFIGGNLTYRGALKMAQRALISPLH